MDEEDAEDEEAEEEVEPAAGEEEEEVSNTLSPVGIKRFFTFLILLIPRAQLMLTNPRDAFRGQSRSPNIVPFHMLGIVSSCAIVNLSLGRAVFLIFDFKKVVTLKSGSEVTHGY